jgi:hypothetical protein
MRKPRPEPKSLWRFWEFLAVLIGILATLELTELLPIVYWPGVVLVYVGLAGIVWEGLRGRWHDNALMRIAIALLGILVLVYWTRAVVFAKVPLLVASQRSMGETAGTMVGDMKWESQWAEIQVYLSNPSDHDIQDVDLEITAEGGMIPRISQLEPVCDGFHAFSESQPLVVDTNNGPILQSSPSISNKYRVACSKFPRGATTTLIVPYIASNSWGTDGKAPSQLFAQKHLPTGCTVKGQYRGLGKTRDVDTKCEFPN